MDLFTLLSPKNLILFVVVFTRLSGMVVTAPLISTYPIPIQIKVWFMALVSFVMFPVVLAKSGFQLPTNIPELTFILLKEFLIGYAIGFIANIIFIGTEICANLISMQMGLTAAQAMNPLTGDESTILTQAYTIIASFVFIGLNAYQYIFGAVFKTFTLMPPGYGFFVDGHFTDNFAHLSAQIFTIGISIALPLFAVLFMSDVLMGFVAKMMPRMNIFMVALPVKIGLGLVLFMFMIPQLFTHFGISFEKYLSNIITIIGG